MKNLVYILLLTLGYSYGHAQNDIRELDKTLKYLGEQLMTPGAELPASFIPTFEEYYAVRGPSARMTKDELKAKFTKQLDKMLWNWTKVQRKLKSPRSILEIDTLTFGHLGLPELSVFIRFEPRDPSSFTSTSQQILLRFFIFENQLKLYRHCGSTLMHHYKLAYLDHVKWDQVEQYQRPYDGKYFSTSWFGVVPFEQKGKWGLKSLEGEEQLPAEYDSIFPFQEGLARVVKEGQYNLMNKELDFLFDSWKPHIRWEEEKGYEVATTAGNYAPLDKSLLIPESLYRQPLEYELASRLGSKYATSEKERSYRLARPMYNPDPPATGPTFFVIQKANGDTSAVLRGFSPLDGYHDYMIGHRNDSLFIFDSKGGLQFSVGVFGKQMYYGSICLMDKKTRRFGVYCPSTDVYIPPVYRCVRAIDGDQFFVVITEEGKMGYLDAKGNKLFDW